MGMNTLQFYNSRTFVSRMSRTSVCVSLVISFSLLTSSCFASLIGDTISVRQAFDPGSGLVTIDTPTDIIVEEGTADETMVGGTTTSPHLFDAEANEFTLFQTSTDWSSFFFNGYVIDSLDWTPVDGHITGVIVGSNINGFTDERVAFDDHSVSLNYQGLSVNNGFVRVQLVVSHVPEPATFALGALGLWLLLVQSSLGHRRPIER